MNPLRKRAGTFVVATAAVVAALVGVVFLRAQGPEAARGVRFSTISQADLREWLTYLSSDEMQGRQVFTEGYGAAAQFIAERLREFGVKPMGDHGTYFQIVRLRSYRVVRHSTVKIEANGRTTTFTDGDHVTFPAASGGRQTVTFDSAEFAGSRGPNDYGGRAVKGKLIVLTPTMAANAGRGGQGGPAVLATGAAASLEYVLTRVPPTLAEEALTRAQQELARANAAVTALQEEVLAERGGGRVAAANRGRGAPGGVAVDIAPTTQRVDGLVPPRIQGDDEFFAALLAGSSTSVADLKARLGRGESVPPFSLTGVRISVSVDNTYEPVTTQLSRNVVGLVEGSDPKLKDTYVLYGAHLDHVGYAISNQDSKGRANNAIGTDAIWNGADDDGTGSTAELAIAKAFARGPRPKRSVVFIWHAGEEPGLYGSKYNVDFPVVPLDKVECLLNIDMIGRNRDNDPTQANSLFVIGADRISTDLHNLIVDTNAGFQAPLALNYEYNDPTDPNTFYTRSDHYSYASRGIPIAFFFTGEHPDYHANTDTVEKILFDKQARIAQLVYQVGFGVAATDRDLRRDNRGPRAGRGFAGRLQ